jgi:hypothetical protein
VTVFFARSTKFTALFGQDHLSALCGRRDKLVGPAVGQAWRQLAESAKFTFTAKNNAADDRLANIVLIFGEDPEDVGRIRSKAGEMSFCNLRGAGVGEIARGRFSARD